MGHKAKRDYGINQRLKQFIVDNDKKPSILADKAGIRRDAFSAILGSRRPVYAEEVLPICLAAGCSVDYLLGTARQPDIQLVQRGLEQRAAQPEQADNGDV